MRSQPSGTVAAVSSGRCQYSFIRLGPRTASSPTSPGATSRPASSSSRTSTSRIGVPMEPGLRGRSGWLKDTTGLVSDMPKPSSTMQPKRRSNPCRISTGRDAPPEMHMRRLATSAAAAPGCCSSAAYMVGTPSNTVARSRAMASSTVCGSKRGTRVSEAPLRTATFMVQVCPKMWNSGRQPTITSSDVSRWTSVTLTSVLWRSPAWVSAAPLGRPVVPDV